MNNEASEQLIAEQVRALATVVLTRRGDLTIVDTRRDTGLDLHVYLNREDKPMRLTLGVLLRGVPTAITPEMANKILGPTMGQFQGLRKFTYPVCLFLFSLRHEQAVFSWLAEPILTDSVPKLVHWNRGSGASVPSDRVPTLAQANSGVGKREEVDTIPFGPIDCVFGLPSFETAMLSGKGSLSVLES